MSNTFESKLAKKWNWGAFLLGPVWALFNKVWIGLIAWTPHLLVIFIMISRIIVDPFTPNYLILEDSIQASKDHPLVYIEYFLGSLTYTIATTGYPITLIISLIWHLFISSILGFKGSKWALKKRKINDLNNFIAHQRKLSIFGFIFGLPLVCINIICLTFLIALNMVV
jgi:hypothetical protein